VTAKPLEDWVAQFVELRESGANPDPEDFASTHPTRSKELLAILQRVVHTEGQLKGPRESRKRLGPYTLLELLGSGGAGQVYRAVHEDRPEQEVALKILSLASSADNRARERFSREGRALLQLNHPALGRVVDSGTLSDVPFIAMEFVQGGDLSDVIRSARRAQQQGSSPSSHLSLPGERQGRAGAVELVTQLAQAVASAHALGILHRDIKPQNVVLRPDGRPVLVDFGLAHDSQAVTLTGTGDLLGTPRYMAPEQARGEAADERTDVFGLGTLLYELLTLRQPHTGDDVVPLLRAAGGSRIPPLALGDPRAPRALQRIVDRACAFRPAARTAKASQLAQELGAYLQGAAVGAKPWSLRERAQDAWALHKPRVIGLLATTVLVATIPLVIPNQPDLDVLLNRACAAFSRGDLLDTAEQAAAVLERDPENETALFLKHVAQDEVPRASSPHMLALIKGMGFSRQKSWPLAVTAFRRAKSLAPDSPLPTILLGQTLDAMDEQALACEASLKADPGSASTWLELGRLRAGQQRFQEAETALREALVRQPDLHEARRELALVLHDQGQEMAVIEATFGPGSKDALDYADSIMRRETDASAQHADSILANYLRTHPADSRALYLRGSAADYQHDFEGARRFYEQSLKQDPHYKRALRELSYLMTGSRRDACADCRQYYEDHPQAIDLDEAEQLLLRLIDSDGGKSSTDYVGYAAARARFIGRTDAVQTLLRKHRSASTGTQQRQRLDQALARLEG